MHDGVDARQVFGSHVPQVDVEARQRLRLGAEVAAAVVTGVEAGDLVSGLPQGAGDDDAQITFVTGD